MQSSNFASRFTIAGLQEMLAQPEGGETSLRQYLREVQDILSLEIPEGEIKDEEVTESYNKDRASYLVTWYNDTTKDVASKIQSILSNILTDVENVEIEKDGPRVGRDTTQLVITLAYDLEDEEEPTTAAPVIKPMEVPFRMELSDNIYRIDSPDSGNSWRIMRNDEVAEEGISSAAAAFGKLNKFILADLSLIESISGGQTPDDMDKTFIEAIGSFFINSPVVYPDAKAALERFVELVTKKVFEDEEEDLDQV